MTVEHRTHIDEPQPPQIANVQQHLLLANQQSQATWQARLVTSMKDPHTYGKLFVGLVISIGCAGYFSLIKKNLVENPSILVASNTLMFSLLLLRFIHSTTEDMYADISHQIHRFVHRG